MNKEYVESVVDEMEIEFPGFVSQVIPGAKEKIIKRLLGERATDAMLKSACGKLAKNWKNRRAPTVRDVLHALESESEGARGNFRIESVQQRVAEHLRVNTETLLAMSARPAGAPCELCIADFVGRGVEPADPLLWHSHFHLSEISADVALEIAIANAARSMGHALEKKCRPMNEEEIANRIVRFQDLARAIAPKFAPAAHSLTIVKLEDEIDPEPWPETDPAAEPAA